MDKLLPGKVSGERMGELYNPWHQGEVARDPFLIPAKTTKQNKDQLLSLQAGEASYMPALRVLASEGT